MTTTKKKNIEIIPPEVVYLAHMLKKKIKTDLIKIQKKIEQSCESVVLL